MEARSLSIGQQLSDAVETSSPILVKDGITLRQVTLASPDAIKLIAKLDAELLALYPAAEDHHFSLTSEQVGTGVFLIAYSLNGQGEEEAIGCAALRKLKHPPLTGEMKRMYVDKEARGKKLGKLLLDAIEDFARGLGLKELWLETGIYQDAAKALYERAGYKRIPVFGDYKSPTSIHMGKNLT